MVAESRRGKAFEHRTELRGLLGALRAMLSRLHGRKLLTPRCASVTSPLQAVRLARATDPRLATTAVADGRPRYPPPRARLLARPPGPAARPNPPAGDE